MIKILIAIIFIACNGSTPTEPVVEPDPVVEPEVVEVVEYCWHDTPGNIVCGYDGLQHCLIVVELTGDGVCRPK